jgi:hypothetical protein
LTWEIKDEVLMCTALVIEPVRDDPAISCKLPAYIGFDMRVTGGCRVGVALSSHFLEMSRKPALQP